MHLAKLAGSFKGDTFLVEYFLVRSFIHMLVYTKWVLLILLFKSKATV